MGTSYYPWKTQVLVDWLRQELNYYDGIQALAASLKLPAYVVRNWLTSPMPDITMPQIMAIANRKRWSVQQTIQWLGLQPAHIETLMTEDLTGKPSRWGKPDFFRFQPLSTNPGLIARNESVVGR